MTRHNALFLIPVLLTVLGFAACCLAPLSLGSSPLSVWHHLAGFLALVFVLSGLGAFAFAGLIIEGPLGRVRDNEEDTSERFGRNRMSQLVTVPCSLNLQLFILLLLVIPGINHHIAWDRWGEFFVCSLLIFVGMELLDLLGMYTYWGKARRVFNDELSRAHRAAALRTGFAITMLGLMAAFVAELFRPESAAYTMPMIMVAGIISAFLHFAWSEWRADG